MGIVRDTGQAMGTRATCGEALGAQMGRQPAILQAERGCDPSPLCLARPQSPNLKLQIRTLWQVS